MKKALLLLLCFLFPLSSIVFAQGSDSLIVETGISEKDSELLYTTYRDTLTSQRQSQNEAMLREIEQRVDEILKRDDTFIKQYGTLEDNFIIRENNYEQINEVKSNNILAMASLRRPTRDVYKINTQKETQSFDIRGADGNKWFNYYMNRYDGLYEVSYLDDGIEFFEYVEPANWINDDITFDDYISEVAKIYTEVQYEIFYLQREYKTLLSKRNNQRKYVISDAFKVIIKDKIFKLMTQIADDKESDESAFDLIAVFYKKKVVGLQKALNNVAVSKTMKLEDKILMHGVLTDLIDMFYEFLVMVKIMDMSGTAFAELMYIEAETGFIQH